MTAATATTTTTETKNLKAPTCVLDNTVVNADTLGNMTDLGLSFFATLCGRNRGAFVLDPTDGQTYGCTAFPSNFATLATGENATTTVPLDDANAIVKTFQQENVTTAETVAYLDYLVKMVYHSSANVDKDPYACNTGGLSKLQCDPVINNNTIIATIKAVTTAGLFVPVPWVGTPENMTTAERQAFYTYSDFKAMQKAGLNTVQIPFPLAAFEQDSKDAASLIDELSTILHHVLKADLQAIVVLVGADNDNNAVTAAAHYAALHSDTILGLTVPSKQTLGAARAAEPNLKLFVPVNQGEIKHLSFADDANNNTFGALDLTHTGTVGDVASSTPQDDRMKLFYHESLACVQRSPLEFSACYRRVPLLVAQGFDLSIDDCVNHQDDHSTNIPFVDYGQCGRFDDTVDSEWWHEHRKSFADRQLFAYERGMGWSFAAWKLYDDTSSSSSGGTIQHFAQLMSFKDVYAAGLMPPLEEGHTEACLNPPVSDFVMGDATYAPTAAPVDCGYGWWNETTRVRRRVLYLSVCACACARVVACVNWCGLMSRFDDSFVSNRFCFRVFSFFLFLCIELHVLDSTPSYTTDGGTHGLSRSPRMSRARTLSCLQKQ